jgi:hypothetical protein|tara:strand:+ start:1303 stop:1500 length:198 start_codon:yes stop_codon:yes gene_type:complete
MAADSFDYVFFSGSKQLLDEVMLDRTASKTYPEHWHKDDLLSNKKIVEEYLQCRYDTVHKKINSA